MFGSQYVVEDSEDNKEKQCSRRMEEKNVCCAQLVSAVLGIQGHVTQRMGETAKMG